jgi:DNA-binding GntR family transcriptional regulator
MQNGLAVPRCATLTVLPAREPPLASLTTVLHRFDLWTLLESHAVAVAAHARRRDLDPVRAVVPSPDHALATPSASADWPRLELRLHRAIGEQSGNPLLAETVERLCADLRPLTPRPGTLWLLHCQHRTILGCIEDRDAEQAVLHTRAHLRLIRDQLLAALSAQGATPRRTRARA